MDVDGKLLVLLTFNSQLFEWIEMVDNDGL